MDLTDWPIGIDDSDDEDSPYMLHLGTFGDFYVTAEEAMEFARWHELICGGSTDFGEDIRIKVGGE